METIALIKLLLAAAEFGVEGTVKIIQALNKDVVTTEDIMALATLVKPPDAYFSDAVQTPAQAQEQPPIAEEPHNAGENG